MIFLVDNYTSPKEVVVYESIDELTNRVEWQDILDKEVIIIDDKGNIYEWDATQKTEQGTVYGYTMRVCSKNEMLGGICFQTYLGLNRPPEFVLEKTE